MSIVFSRVLDIYIVEDEGTTLPRNVENRLPSDVEPYPNRTDASATPLRKAHDSYICVLLKDPCNKSE